MNGSTRSLSGASPVLGAGYAESIPRAGNAIGMPDARRTPAVLRRDLARPGTTGAFVASSPASSAALGLNGRISLRGVRVPPAV